MTENKPSRTASVVAASLVYLRSDARVGGLITDDTVRYCRQFLRSAGCGRLLRLAEHPHLRGAVRLLERITLPGIMLHYALRKRFLRDWALASIAEGCKQVVVLGAGFDPLCLELHRRFPDVRFVEVDHPATQAAKRAALAELGVKPRNVCFVAADLARAPLDQALSACTERHGGTRTLYVAEGLLMYLDAHQVLNLLRRALRAAPSRIAFTFLEPQADGRPNFRNSSKLVDLWLKRTGEPFAWGVSRTDLRNALKRLRCTVREISSGAGLVARYLGTRRTAGLATVEGEYACVADPGPKEARSGSRS